MYPRNRARFHPASYAGTVDRLQRQILTERRAAADEIARLRAALQDRDAQLRMARSEADLARRAAEVSREEAVAAREALAARPERAQADPAALSDARRKLHRLAADMANLRRRQDEALAQARSEARAVLLREFVEVLDGMERALEISTEPDSPWHQGSEALRRQMEAVLTRAGVQRLGAVGERFDPRLHEAVGTTPHSEQPVDHIAATLQAGYRFDDGTLIRAARVVVAA